ncbi:MAG: PilZ domain-containing protein [Planctomycetes bacterium]|nr:PilZ domain-containing protein [Planctomycetota bacterium]
MSRITVLDTMADPRVTALELVGKELCEITFSLNGDLMLIEANGKCVWEVSVNDGRYVGVRFKNMKQNYIEIISDYVCKQRNN